MGMLLTLNAVVLAWRLASVMHAFFDGRYPEPVPYDVASRKFLLEEPVASRG